MRKSAWSVATCLETSARTVAAVGLAARAKERKRMSKCVERSSRSTKPTESWATGRNTSTGTLIRVPRSKSGPATLPTVKILLALIRMMVARNRSYKGANRGAEVTDNATVHLQYRNDGKSARVESSGWLAV